MWVLYHLKVLSALRQHKLAFEWQLLKEHLSFILTFWVQLAAEFLLWKNNHPNYCDDISLQHQTQPVGHEYDVSKELRGKKKIENLIPLLKFLVSAFHLLWSIMPLSSTITSGSDQHFGVASLFNHTVSMAQLTIGAVILIERWDVCARRGAGVSGHICFALLWKVYQR